MFTQQQLKVIEYCAEEVKRQGDTPNHVYLKGTLDNPVWPPNFWNVSNP